MLSGPQPDMVEMSCKWTIPFHVEGELMAWAVTCMFSMALLITERDGNEGTITWADYLGRYPIRRNPSVYAFFFRRWHRPSTQKRSRRISRRNVAAKVVTDRCWHPLRWFSSHRSIRFPVFLPSPSTASSGALHNCARGQETNVHAILSSAQQRRARVLRAPLSHSYEFYISHAYVGLLCCHSWLLRSVLLPSYSQWLILQNLKAFQMKGLVLTWRAMST